MVIMKEHSITLKFWDFRPPIEAVYYCYPGKNPVSGIDYKIKNGKKHFRCVLAEELGHFLPPTTEASSPTIMCAIGLVSVARNTKRWSGR